jgi:hypothetical protein
MRAPEPVWTTWRKEQYFPSPDRPTPFKRTSFQNAVFSSYLEFRTMDKVHKPCDSERYIPSSEPFRSYFSASVKKLALQKDFLLIWNSKFQWGIKMHVPNHLNEFNIFTNIFPGYEHMSVRLLPDLDLSIRYKDCFIRHIQVGRFLDVYLKNRTPWPESASEIYRPNDRRFSAKLVPTLRIEGATWLA